METVREISIQQLAVEKRNKVKAGRLSREEAKRCLDRHFKHLSKSRENLIEELVRDYDQETVEALEFFGLI